MSQTNLFEAIIRGQYTLLKFEIYLVRSDGRRVYSDDEEDDENGQDREPKTVYEIQLRSPRGAELEIRGHSLDDLAGELIQK